MHWNRQGSKYVRFLFVSLYVKRNLEFSADLGDNTNFEPTAIICPLGQVGTDRTIPSDLLP